MENTIARQIALWTALSALLLIPLTPLIVVDGFFFPFISGKAFFFRILVEIMVVAWMVLACLDAEYRPRFSWISVAVISFVAWMLVADSVAINATKAFWSNFERMEGWVLLVHLLGFFCAASSLLGVKKYWRNWFLISLGVSTIVAMYALFQLAGLAAIHQGSTRIDASFGNSAYLAIYFLFNVFIALWLALTEKRTWLAYMLVGLAVLEGVLIFFTETRGTVIGFALALALAALLTATTASKRFRVAAVIVFLGIVTMASSLYMARTSDFVKNNHVFERITSVSLSDGQTRFTIWGMAFKGVEERPIFGWGQEGFNYIFNKYHDSSLYAQEPWFDRAHNAFIDWLTAGGIPAFLLYIGLFGSAIILLWSRSELSRPERIVLTAAFVGYAVHNLFVFDNLYSYVYFFALLALIHSQVARPIKRFEELPKLHAEEGMTYALPIATVVGVALIWFVNISGMNVSDKLIAALTPSSYGVKENLRLFTELAEHPSFAMQEVREQMVSFAASVLQSPQTSSEEKRQAVSLAITEMQKQVAAYPLDARERLQLAYAYRIVGNGAEALREIREAEKLSPGKVQIHIEEGMTLWDQGDTLGAQKAFSAAYELAPQFPELAVYAAVGHIISGDPKTGDAILLKTYGSTVIDNDVLALALYRTKQWARLASLWKLRAERPSAGPDAWFSLAAAYYLAGDKTTAIKYIQHAVELHPEVAPNAAAIIEQIRSGKPIQ